MTRPSGLWPPFYVASTKLPVDTTLAGLHAPVIVALCRSPEEPRKVLIKRLVGVEGDWVTVPGDTKVEKIPKARA